jgi:hypothetical protein
LYAKVREEKNKSIERSHLLIQRKGNRYILKQLYSLNSSSCQSRSKQQPDKGNQQSKYQPSTVSHQQCNQQSAISIAISTAISSCIHKSRKGKTIRHES